MKLFRFPPYFAKSQNSMTMGFVISRSRVRFLQPAPFPSQKLSVNLCKTTDYQGFRVRIRRSESEKMRLQPGELVALKGVS